MKKKYEWDLNLFYSASDDPKIEIDSVAFEKAYEAFAKKYDTAHKSYLTNSDALLTVLTDYEKLREKDGPNPYLYFHYKRDLDGRDIAVTSRASLLSNRFAKAYNQIRFFIVSLTKIPIDTQNKFLADNKLARYRYFLSCIFADGKHTLSAVEENILSLKDLPAYQMWIEHNERILSSLNITWKGKKMPLQESLSKVLSLRSASERAKMSALNNMVCTFLHLPNYPSSNNP